MKHLNGNWIKTNTCQNQEPSSTFKQTNKKNKQTNKKKTQTRTYFKQCVVWKITWWMHAGPGSFTLVMMLSPHENAAPVG